MTPQIVAAAGDLMQDVAVVYLAWHGAGIESFVRFLDSYRARRAGCNHTLVVVFKEIPVSAQVTYDTALLGVPHERIFLPAPCLDIPAYLEVSRRISSQYVCLLNSSSEILADDWLYILSELARVQGVGAVSATGSWESHLTNTLESWRHSAIQGNLLPAEQMRNSLAEIAEEFLPFPNCHLRTNALVIERERFLQIPFVWRSGSKAECLAFESGWSGLTQQLVRAGLQPIVANSQGHAYSMGQWPESKTFRMGEQEHLLVADNRTRDYLRGTAGTRNLLRFLAWGR